MYVVNYFQWKAGEKTMSKHFIRTIVRLGEPRRLRRVDQLVLLNKGVVGHG